MSIRSDLLALPFVVARRLNGKDAFFTAGRMFALMGERSLLLRLPPAGSAALVEAIQGEPLIAPAVPSALAWVTVPLPAADPDQLGDLILAAHQAVRAAGRRPSRSHGRHRRVRAGT